MVGAGDRRRPAGGQPPRRHPGPRPRARAGGAAAPERLAPVLAAGLEAALERLGGAAAVVDDLGAVLHANALARAALAADPAGQAARLRRAVAGGLPALSVTPLAAAGPVRHYLVIEPGPAEAPSVPAARAALLRRRWGLTSRQAEVLVQLARGRGNKAIAAELRVAEGTVEAHVTALLTKSGCGARAELVARFWTEG